MDYVTIEATAAEILADRTVALQVKNGWKVRFRHFMVESGDYRTKTGVRHRRYSKAKIVVKDGAPFVRHHGELQQITAWKVTAPDGRTFLSDMRVKSAYLPRT